MKILSKLKFKHLFPCIDIFYFFEILRSCFFFKLLSWPISDKIKGENFNNVSILSDEEAPAGILKYKKN